MEGLILRYCKSVLISIAAITVMTGTWYMTRKFKEKNPLPVFLIGAGISTFCIYKIMTTIGASFHSWSVCLVSLNAVLLAYCIYREWKMKGNGQVVILLFLMLMPFIPSAGSDTGFQKSTMMACAIAPVTVMHIKKYAKDTFYVNLFYTATALVSALIFSGHIFTMTATINSTSDNRAIRHIRLERWQIKAYEQWTERIRPYYKKDKTIFYGYDPSHYLYTYTGTKALYHVPFWMEKNDTKELSNAIDAMKNDPQCVFFDFTDTDEEMFTERGLRCISKEEGMNVYSY